MHSPESSADSLEIEDGDPALNRTLAKGWLAAQWGISEAKEFDKLVRAIQLVMRTA